MSATIKAAYNFVPVEKDQKYFQPDIDWVNQVSQDLPFSDGVCGEITLKITAQTPLAIKDSNNNPTFPTLSSGEKFIPATTIKGMIRSVLEILSFGHLDGSRVQDSHVTSRNELIHAKTTHCGWLQRNGNNRATIYDWGIPAAIKHSELFKTVENQRKFKDLDLFEKYKTLKLNGEQTLVEDGVLKDSGRKLFKIGCGSQKGYIVYTGKTIGSRANREFVFLKPESGQPIESYKIGKGEDGENLLEKYDNLFEIYKKNNRSKDIQKNKDLRCPSHRDGFEPVFFTLKGGKIVSIGNVLLHKDYTQYSVYDAIPEQLRQANRDKDCVDRLDLADIIFGTTNPKCTMRGRVQFGHGFQCYSKEEIKPETKNAILAEPKISFFNTYLQSGDWKKTPSLIAGRKRYPIRKVLLPLEIYKSKEQNGEQKKENNAGTSFQTIPSGSAFKTTIRFHNLREQELGALLSAITFHGNSDCCHSMGQAKAYGYGSVKVEIDNNFVPIPNQGNKKTESIYIGQFEKLMTDKFDKSWLQSTAIKELFAMARGVESDKNKLFEPISLSEGGNGSENTYRRLKNSNIRLDKFSDIIAKGKTPLGVNNNQSAPKKSQAVEVEGVLNTDPRFSTKGDSRIWIEPNKSYRGYVPHGGCFIVNDKKGDKKASYNIKGKKIDDYQKKQVNIKVTKISSDRKRITVEITIK